MKTSGMSALLVLPPKVFHTLLQEHEEDYWIRPRKVCLVKHHILSHSALRKPHKQGMKAAVLPTIVLPAASGMQRNYDLWTWRFHTVIMADSHRQWSPSCPFLKPSEIVEITTTYDTVKCKLHKVTLSLISSEYTVGQFHWVASSSSAVGEGKKIPHPPSLHHIKCCRCYHIFS